MTAAEAMNRRMPDVARQAMLLDVPDVGRVVRLRNRIALDFSPHLRGTDRYLYAFAGRPFVSQEQAIEVLQTIRRDARHMPLVDAAARFKGRRARAHLATEVVERYLAAAPMLVSERTDRMLRPRTIAAYAAVLRRMRPFLEGQTILEATRADTLRRLKAWYRLPAEKGGRGLATDQEARLAFGAFRAVVAWYRTTRRDFPEPDWPSMPSAIAARRRSKVSRHEREIRLTLDDVVRVISRMPEGRQLPYWLMFYTGARPTEARAVLVEDWARPYVRIGRSASGATSRAEALDGTKTYEARTCRLPDHVCELADRAAREYRLQPRAPLCRNQSPIARGPLIAHETLGDWWAAASAAAGVPLVPLYRAMKHSQVSALISAGLDPNRVAEMYAVGEGVLRDHYDERRDERRGEVVDMLEKLAGKARADGATRADRG